MEKEAKIAGDTVSLQSPSLSPHYNVGPVHQGEVERGAHCKRMCAKGGLFAYESVWLPLRGLMVYCAILSGACLGQPFPQSACTAARRNRGRRVGEGGSGLGLSTLH